MARRHFEMIGLTVVLLISALLSVLLALLFVRLSKWLFATELGEAAIVGQSTVSIGVEPKKTVEPLVKPTVDRDHALELCAEAMLDQEESLEIRRMMASILCQYGKAELIPARQLEIILEESSPVDAVAYLSLWRISGIEISSEVLANMVEKLSLKDAYLRHAMLGLEPVQGIAPPRWHKSEIEVSSEVLAEMVEKLSPKDPHLKDAIRSLDPA